MAGAGEDAETPQVESPATPGVGPVPVARPVDRRQGFVGEGPVRDVLRLPLRAVRRVRSIVRSRFRKLRKAVRRGAKRAFTVRTAVLAFPFWDALAVLETSSSRTGRFVQRHITPLLWRYVGDAARRPQTRSKMWPFIYAYSYGIYLEKGSTFIQVGASQGQDTERIWRALGPKGLILAIEPVAENYARLIERIDACGMTNVRPRHVGASDRAGEVRFLLGGPKQHVAMPDHSTISWTTGETEEFLAPDLREELIHVDTLDNILAGQSLGEGTVHAMLETNGSELDVLHGMEKTLEQVDDIVVAGSAVRRDAMPVVDDMVSFLEERGFDTHSIGEDRAADRHDRLVGKRRRR